MNIKKSVLISAIVVLVQATQASAAVICNGTSIGGTLTHGTAYGGCMAKIPEGGQCATDLAAAGCAADYVSIGCAGDPAIGISKANANVNFSAVQLAFVSGSTADLVIEPLLKYQQAYCVVTQVIVNPATP